MQLVALVHNSSLASVEEIQAENKLMNQTTTCPCKSTASTFNACISLKTTLTHPDLRIRLAVQCQAANDSD